MLRIEEFLFIGIGCLPASPDIETNLLKHDKGFAGHGLQPRLFYLRNQKSMREKFNLLIKSCATRPDSYRDVPAAKTKSIGLQADARVVMVFARYLDSFIVTCQILPTYRDHAIWTV